jgi:hypothetical protein
MNTPEVNTRGGNLPSHLGEKKRKRRQKEGKWKRTRKKGERKMNKKKRKRKKAGKKKRNWEVKG